jgi:hypothetical protein
MNSCFKGKFKVTSGYKLPERLDHKGIDLVGLTDKTVYAPCDGTIGSSTIVTDKSNKTWEWGNYVRLDTADGKYSLFFCHLASRAVVKGRKVKKGDKLGVMGHTGYCIPSGVKGTHTHFEVRKKGTSVTIDPAEFLGIPNKVGTYEYIERKMLESGNDIVWQLMNGVPAIEINEPQRAIKALDKAKNDADFMSLYWIIYKMVNGNG